MRTNILFPISWSLTFPPPMLISNVCGFLWDVQKSHSYNIPKYHALCFDLVLVGLFRYFISISMSTYAALTLSYSPISFMVPSRPLGNRLRNNNEGYQYTGLINPLWNEFMITQICVHILQHIYTLYIATRVKHITFEVGWLPREQQGIPADDRWHQMCPLYGLSLALWDVLLISNVLQSSYRCSKLSSEAVPLLFSSEY